MEGSYLGLTRRKRKKSNKTPRKVNAISYHGPQKKEEVSLKQFIELLLLKETLRVVLLEVSNNTTIGPLGLDKCCR